MTSSLPDLSLSRSLAPDSRQTRLASRRLVRVLSELTRALGRAPDPAEVALAMQMSEEDYRASLRGVANDGAEPVELFGLDVVEGELAVAQLPEASRVVLALFYTENCSFPEIASVLGIAEARACELHTEALHLLGAVIALRREGPARSPVVHVDFSRFGGSDVDSEPPPDSA